MADFNSKYTGAEVEQLLDQVANGEVGGETLTEADIAAMGFTKNEGTITEVKMNGVSKGTSGIVDLGTVITAHQDISGKVDKVTGKGLSTEDFTSALKSKLEGLSNYDDTTLSNALTTLRNDFDKLVSGDTTTAIKTFNEIVAFLDGIEDSQDLEGIIASIEQQIADKQEAISDLETIREGAAKGATALQSVPSEYVTDNDLIWVKADGEAGVRLKGTNGTATGNLAISAGDDKTASDGTLYASVASGDHAVAFGFGNTCAGRTTLAQGLYNIVNGKDSVAFGQRNIVSGDQAFAAGQLNEVTTRLGVTLGYKNKATNTNSIAIGYQNTSGGSGSVALGDTCESSGTSSTAMGYKTKATGAYSATFGENTQATNNGEVAMGLYNKSTTSTDSSEQTLFSFGIGTSDTNRLNAFEIKKNGDVYIGDKLLSNGGDGSEDIYITPFTVEDVASLYYGNIATLSIPISLIEAVIAKKRVLIPSEYDFGNGFAELTYAEGYIGGGDAGLCAYFFMQTELYQIYIDDVINGDAIIANEEHVVMIRVADANSIVGISSIEQTTTSNADGGSNIITATLSNGVRTTFTIKNGSKGSQGIQGEQGPKGDTGATGPQGPKGDKGDTGANGTNGVSVSSVKQTTTSTADGGTNVVTVTLSNGTTSTFNVKNGSKGSNGTNGKDGADGEDGVTFTPSVDYAGNLSWTNNGGLTNPPTVNIKGPKGDKGDSGGGGGGTITEIKANGTSIATSGVANIPAASTSAYGVIMLSSSTSNTSTTLAATASAVKAAYDLANGKASMTDVNNAIAVSITNVINASY